MARSESRSKGDGLPRHPATRYFVKCAACDQVFWLSRSDAPLPDHGPWNRRQDRQPTSDTGCPGSGNAGHWIGVEEEET